MEIFKRKFPQINFASCGNDHIMGKAESAL